jgi:hypothetical protein
MLVWRITAAPTGPLGLVGVEQGGVCPAGADQGQFPGQVDGVLDAGVHSLAAGRAVDVRGVAGEQDAAEPVLGDLAVVDLEIGQPV